MNFSRDRRSCEIKDPLLVRTSTGQLWYPRPQDHVTFPTALTDSHLLSSHFAPCHSMRGVILGTPGAGNGLDHEDVRDVLGAIEAAGLTVFLHPHYGVGNEHFGNAGHSLFLALGFPFETTVSVSKLIGA